MKTIKITVPTADELEMSKLADIACRMQDKDPGPLRDKFKIIDIVNPKKLLDLCTHLGLDVEFKNTKKKKEVVVKFITANNFDITSIGESESVDPVADLEPDGQDTFESVVDEVDPSPVGLDDEDPSATPEDDDDSFPL